MKKMWTVVALVTMFAVFFNISPFIGIPDKAIMIMFLISPAPVLWMAYAILKYGKPSGATFDEKFYDDL